MTVLTDALTTLRTVFLERRRLGYESFFALDTRLVSCSVSRTSDRISGLKISWRCRCTGNSGAIATVKASESIDYSAALLDELRLLRASDPQPPAEPAKLPRQKRRHANYRPLDPILSTKGYRIGLEPWKQRP